MNPPHPFESYQGDKAMDLMAFFFYFSLGEVNRAQ